MTMHARSLEFVEGALAQSSPDRRFVLLERALDADPGSPHAHALLGHASPFLDEAQACYARACALSRSPGRAVPDRSMRMLLELAAAARDIAALDPHAAVERILPAARAGVDGPLRTPAYRLLASAASASGDWEALAVALKRGGDALGEEGPWFGFLLEAGLGREASDACEKAWHAAPRVAEFFAAGRPFPKRVGNPAYLYKSGAGGLLSAQASVAAGLAQSPHAADQAMASGKRLPVQA